MTMPLEDEHTRLGAVMETRGAVRTPSHYGDPVAEHLAVRQSAGVADLSHRGVWRLAGPDAERFLQGTLSNDVAALTPGQGCYALSLTGRGKIVSEVIVLRRANDFLMHAPAETREAGFASLDRFLIGDDAELTDETGRMGIIGVYGPAAREVASCLGEVLPAMADYHFVTREVRGETVLLAGASWTGEEGIEILAPACALPSIWAALLDRAGGRAVGTAALDTLRIEAGTPRGGVDFDTETLPQSAGLEHALSHTKGCYRGQEIVLRVHTKGAVKHALGGIALDAAADPPPPAGTRILTGEREAGWITSAVRSPTLGLTVALAQLQKAARAPETPVVLATSVPRSARVVALPFYRRD